MATFLERSVQAENKGLINFQSGHVLISGTVETSTLKIHKEPCEVIG